MGVVDQLEKLLWMLDQLIIGPEIFCEIPNWPSYQERLENGDCDDPVD